MSKFGGQTNSSSYIKCHRPGSQTRWKTAIKA